MLPRNTYNMNLPINRFMTSSIIKKYQNRKARMTCKINNRLLQVCLDFCRCSTAFNSSNNFVYAKTDVKKYNDY